MSHQDDIKKLITTYSRRLQKLKEQQAMHGLNTPPATLLEADIHNFLPRCFLTAKQPAQARQFAQLAREQAWCDGPPYTYQSALDEADSLLAEIGGKT